MSAQKTDSQSNIHETKRESEAKYFRLLSPELAQEPSVQRLVLNEMLDMSYGCRNSGIGMAGPKLA